MRLTLLHVPHDAAGQSATPLMAAGLGRIALAARRAGHDVEVRNLFVEGSHGLAERSQVALTVGGDVLGISFHWSLQAEAVLSFLDTLAQRSRRPRTIVGGLTASVFTRELAASHPWVEICNDVTPEALGWLDGRPRVVEPEDLLSLTDPALAAVELAQARAAGFWSDRAVGPVRVLVPSGGCTWRCPLCGSAAAPRVWAAAPKSVADAMSKDLDLGFEGHYLCTDPHPARRHLGEIVDELRARQWPGPVSCAVYDPRDLDTLGRFAALPSPGLVELSLESASQDVRRQARGMRPPISTEDLDRACTLLVRRGVEVQIYASYFLPGDNIDSVRETAGYLWDLSARFRGRLRCYYLACTTDPGSPAFGAPGAFGLSLRARSLEAVRALVRRYAEAGSLANPLGSTPVALTGQESLELALCIELVEARRQRFFHGRKRQRQAPSFLDVWEAALAEATGATEAGYITATRRRRQDDDSVLTDVPG